MSKAVLASTNLFQLVKSLLWEAGLGFETAETGFFLLPPQPLKDVDRIEAVIRYRNSLEYFFMFMFPSNQNNSLMERLSKILFIVSPTSGAMERISSLHFSALSACTGTELVATSFSNGDLLILSVAGLDKTA